MNLADKKIEVQDLRLANPDRLSRDRLRIGYLTAVLSREGTRRAEGLSEWVAASREGP